jgi:hypothetical protein
VKSVFIIHFSFNGCGFTTFANLPPLKVKLTVTKSQETEENLQNYTGNGNDFHYIVFTHLVHATYISLNVDGLLSACHVSSLQTSSYCKLCSQPINEA